MGSCCSCPDKESIPDNHQTKFKVINVDDDGNELGSGIMELTEEELILHTHKRHAVRWPYLCLRRYGYDSNLFSFESGRRCQTGQGIFAFKCARAEEIFNMLQDVMHNNSISVVEEPVLEANHSHVEPDLPRTPRTPTTPGYTGPALPNGVPHPRYPSFGEGSSRPSSRHPSVGSARLPSVGEESTHPLLVADEPIHTYVNTSGVQDERSAHKSSQGPTEPRLSLTESMAPPEEPEPRVLLEPEGVKFVLGPTPVQKQLMAKQQQRVAGDGEQKGGEPAPPVPPPPLGGINGGVVPGNPVDCDTGYDSDERKETPPVAKPAYEHFNGTASGPAPRRSRPPMPLPDAQNVNNSAQRRTALLNYENLPALPPVWEAPKPSSEGEEDEEEEEEAFAPKTPSLNGYHQHSSLDPMHNYVNTENVTVPLSAHKLDSGRQRDSSAPTVFNFDLRRPGPEAPRQLNYIEVEMERGSDSSNPQTPKTPTTPLPQTPTRRTELYAVIDIERTAAMSILQKALPRDDGTARKTRHNSTDLPM
ncbi:fibroblast growth factor receptor substrate 2a isoform X1 [Paramormyrops kingsleyae]|uniref:Fibroblast growth factor receptor substrate 2a n=1 Tax=Paramormyrops kingsleyae TaxID=1676925 RepID=A0A3B3QLD0_9TELE|nr:fibroblast growth factor receptor substrate 2 isoform X1 [Paramormyrops kingsleyae]XP_023682225.1 fibroblast growth factor receptor substrate 2 isoform X1 [Paramormyrops kingsleyae]XP_023682231.1 fibroblast growth factor receptor substrate 2 isoform X1 [Paramormyrops kingsleyae]XP_023682240.1 fibroblast growth factor receptor substrate 2 isoform X1 [Paramormyrops kingsleyae]